MAFTNYTELLAVIADRLHRDDLTTQMVEFVALAESEINSEMRLRLMEADESLTLTSGTRTIALPARYIEPVKLSLVISGQENTELQYVQPQQLAINAASGASSRPQYWTVNGSNIELPNLSDATYSCTLRMIKGFDLAATSTNALLTAYPGIYMYGALIQSSYHIGVDPRLDSWRLAYGTLKQKAMRSEARSKALTNLVTNLPGVGSGYSNIITG